MIENGKESAPLLDVWQLAGVTFFSVCGGPYGLEPAIKTGGPWFALLGIVLVPWLWGLPQALLTAELSTAMPDAGGPVGWIYGAFGRAIAANCFFVTVLGSILDSTIYPIMFADYLLMLSSADKASTSFAWSHRGLGLALVLAATLINCRPARDVGKGAMYLSMAVIFPFVLMAVSLLFIGCGSMHFERLWSLPREPDRMSSLAVLIWSYSGFDATGQLASEIRDARHAYMKAMRIVLVASTAVYAFPLLAGVLGPEHFDLQEWRDGYWVQLGHELLGRTGSFMVMAAGALSAAGLFSASLMANTRCLAAGVPLGFAPAIFQVKNDGAPVVAVCVMGFAAAALGGFSFEMVIDTNSMVFSFRQALLFAALVQLRLSEPSMPRPFRIPLGPCWLCVMAAPSVLVALAMLAKSSQVSYCILAKVAMDRQPRVHARQRHMLRSSHMLDEV